MTGQDPEENAVGQGTLAKQTLVLSSRRTLASDERTDLIRKRPGFGVPQRLCRTGWGRWQGWRGGGDGVRLGMVLPVGYIWQGSAGTASRTTCQPR